MDNFNFAKDGGCKLPPGFRFEPTDEEIVFQYLSRKTFSHPLPGLVIPEIDNIFSFDPWELPGNSEEDRYFFSKKEGNNRYSKQTGRATCSGFWKATGSAKRIICSKSSPIVGIRKSLVFCKGGKHCRAVRTDWIMHEYCIALSENADCNIQETKNSQGSLVRIGNWTLCRIFLKKGDTTTEGDDDDTRRSYDFLTGDTSDTDSSSASSSSPHSDSSVFTEVSSS